MCGALRVIHDLRATARVPMLRCDEAPTALLAEAASAAGLGVIDPGILPASEDFANIAE